MKTPLSYISTCLFLFICFFCHKSLYGQHSQEHPWEVMVASDFSLMPDAEKRGEERTFFLVRLKHEDKEGALYSAGMSVKRKLDRQFYVCEASDVILLKHKKHIAQAWRANALWKLSPILLEAKNTPDHNLRKTGKVILTLQVDDLEGFKSSMAVIPSVSMLDITPYFVRVECSYEDMEKYLLYRPEVSYIGIESMHPKTEAIVFDMNLVPNGINRVRDAFPDLDGDGMTLSIKEQRYDTSDIDLKGRHIPTKLASEVINRHATEMASLAAGEGNSSGNSRGVAPAAKLTSSDFIEVLPDKDQDYIDTKAFVQNHSYGTQVEGFYGARARAFDLSTNNNFMLLHVFSSGNQGESIPEDGAYKGIKGFANLTGNHKMAKNILTVGSVDAQGTPISFSSRGPAFDGRIKPELVSYSQVGSSNSAALVSGVAILLQQAYSERNGGDYPASALLKALLINSARDVGAKGPDFITGYGNVDAYRGLKSLDRYFSGSLFQGEEETFTLKVPEGSKNLKVTLVWSDPSAPANSNLSLVNDLDLSITDGQGKSWLPWVLDHTADPDRLKAPAKRQADHLNNIEQVSIEAPTSGTYTVTVTGFNLPIGPQPFYIVYQWDEKDAFVWSYPTGSDNVPHDGSAAEETLRWDSTIDAEKGRLEYRTDTEKDWIKIADEVDLRTGSFIWEVPDISSKARLRMVVGNDGYESDPFILSKSPVVEIGFNCTDSVLLQWSKVSGIAQYRLFNYDPSAGLLPVLTAVDTTAIIKTADYPSRLFALQPLIDDTTAALRGATFDYGLLGASCYEMLLSTEIIPQQGVSLNLELSSTYGVKELYFERASENSGFARLATLNSGEIKDREIKWLDEYPINGLNIYRGHLLLQNGKQLLTKSLEVYYDKELKVLIYPNPLKISQPLNFIFSDFKNKKTIFHLYDRQAQHVLTKEIGLKNEIMLPKLETGLYFFILEMDNERSMGKLVIRE